ncbi:MAG TPA: hypothetical protein VFN29_04955 [Chiayiivirga sp.]|nr:hypothetical protein [Chiayiivirga sp.]
MSSAPSQAASVDTNDAQVISLCLEAVHAQTVEATGARGDVVHVLPIGPQPDSAWIPVTRPPLAQSWMAEAEQNLRTRQRQGDGWTPPQKYDIHGTRARLKDLYDRRPWEQQPLHYLLWPPGYDASNTHALVVATFGPTPKGGELSCSLELTNGQWGVVDQKVTKN